MCLCTLVHLTAARDFAYVSESVPSLSSTWLCSAIPSFLCFRNFFFFSHRKKKKRRRKEVRLQGQRIKWANLWKQLPQSSTEQHLWLGTGDICGSGFSSLETPNSRSLSYIFLIFLQKDFFKKILIYVYVHVSIYAHTGQKKTSDPPGPQVTVSWNLPNVDGGKQTWVY